MKKTVLILILMFTFSTSYSQFKSYEPAKLILKSGDTIDDILGKLNRKRFKYKTDYGSKAKKVKLSEIRSLEIGYSYDRKKLEYYEVIGQDRYKGIEKVMQGNGIIVYKLNYSYTNTLAGGMTMSGTASSYYVRKIDEDKVTFIGNYDAIKGQFKRRVYAYFSDCDKLIKKLDDKEIRLRDGFKNIAEFYISNCD
jgi:hypothetical protein